MLRFVRRWARTGGKRALEEPASPDMARTMKRRGIAAGVAVLLAGLLTKATERKAYAADFDFLELGNTADPATGPQSASNTTELDKDNTVNSPAFVLTNASNGDGLDVTTSGPNGIAAISTATNGMGVVGTANTGAAAVGVMGQSNSGNGVLGQTAVGGPFANIAGVSGKSSGTNGVGVFGVCNTGANASGVYGYASGVGVYGFSPSTGGNGVFGWTTAGFAGVSGRCDNPSGWGVYCTGNFAATGTKNALVPHPDGSHRALYCMESPQSWFEDFGAGTLADGTATVQLDPDFAALVHTDVYQVFLTEYGASNGLYVSSRGPTGFTVRERNAGTSSVQFGYRVVAKRKDVAAPRLAKVKLPVGPTVAAVPTLPKALPASG